MNKLYRDLILSRSQATVGAAQAVARLSHAGLRGQIREIVVRDLLNPILPPQIGIGSGQIITAFDDQSRQQDIILYDRTVVPPVLFENRNGVFPIESVLIAIEVKSTLTRTELIQANESAAQLMSFKYAPGVDDSPVLRERHEIEAISSGLIAFDTDLSGTGKSELQRYQELCDPAKPALRSLCVVGKGYWFFAENKWHEWPMTEPGSEVASFITGIINTYQRIASTRLKPDFRSYLL